MYNFNRTIHNIAAKYTYDRNDINTLLFKELIMIAMELTDNRSDIYEKNIHINTTLNTILNMFHHGIQEPQYLCDIIPEIRAELKHLQSLMADAYNAYFQTDLEDLGIEEADLPVELWKDFY